MSARSEEVIACAWIHLSNVHSMDQCQKDGDQPCVIHNPTPHHMRFWNLHWRNDRGIFERICPHGIGHPDPDQFAFWKKLHGEGMGAEAVHGCDGCCSVSGSFG